jgi:hypothetical protein
MTDYRVVYARVRSFTVLAPSRDISDTADAIVGSDNIRITRAGDTRITRAGDTRVTRGTAFLRLPVAKLKRKRSFTVIGKRND